jgi:hypothetical protein
MAPTLHEAIDVARRKAFVTLDGTLLRIDRVAMASGRDRPYYSGKHKAHGVNVQVIADPAGRLIWASPALPGARHDMGAAGHRRDLVPGSATPSAADPPKCGGRAPAGPAVPAQDCLHPIQRVRLCGRGQ